MKIVESVTKMFALFSDSDDKAKIKVVADPEHNVVRIIGGGGTATLYRHELEAVASTLLVAEEWMKLQQGGDYDW